MKSLRDYINIVLEADYPMGARPESGQITMTNLTPAEYTAKMNAVNQMRQQAGQAPVAVTPANQIATPTDTAPKVVYDQNSTGAGARPTPPRPAAPKDPKVVALQQKLNSLGAKLVVDGIMGPATQAAMAQFKLDANGNPINPAPTPAPAAPSQPPATAAKPELGTVKGATQAIPTGPTAPAVINGGSGVGKSATLDPAQQAAAAEIAKAPDVSARDKAAIAQLNRNTTGAPTPAPAAPVAGNVGPQPAGFGPAARQWAAKYAKTHDPVSGNPLKENTELDRIVNLVNYR